MIKTQISQIFIKDFQCYYQ